MTSFMGIGMAADVARGSGNLRGVEKLSFARLFGRRSQEKPVLVSAGAEEDAAPARVVNG